MKKFILLITLLFFCFGFSSPHHRIIARKNAEAPSCYDCSGVGAHLWECNSTTVGEGTPCGCTDNDSTASGTGDVGIATGLCSFDDTVSEDGNDYYTFGAPSTTIDESGTVFIKFRINTAVASIRLFQIIGTSGAVDRLQAYLYGSTNIAGLYLGNSVSLDVRLSGGNTAVDTWYIARYYWNDGGTDSHRITLLNGSTSATIEDNEDVEALTAFSTNSASLECGNHSAITSSDFDIDYIHVYTGWVETDPNG